MFWWNEKEEKLEERRRGRKVWNQKFRNREDEENERGLKMFLKYSGNNNKQMQEDMKIKDFDIIVLTETCGKETWKKIKGRLSGNYEWHSIMAIRNNKKGRAKDGIIMAVSKLKKK